MTDRPTVEELVNEIEGQGGFPSDLMDVFGRFGYRIVHDDDQRDRDEAIIDACYDQFVGDARPMLKAAYDRIIATTKETTP